MTCSINGRNTYKYLILKTKRDGLGDLEIGGRIILKRMLKK
jgi:hypothetical protein